MSSSNNSTAPRHARLIRGTFLAVVVLFAFQYWFTVRVTEPYPALILPAFSGAGMDDEGRFSFENADVAFRFADGTSEPVRLRALFPRFPGSQHSSMAETALKPKPRAGPAPANPWEDSGWKKHLPWHLVPGYVLTRQRQLYWNGVEPATTAWMRSRAGSLYPERPAVGFTVAWYRDTVEWRDGRMIRRRTPIVSLQKDW